MKIWYGYGTEHSMNLVMIGCFKEMADADKAEQLIDFFMEKVRSEVDLKTMEIGDPPPHYSDEWMDFLRRMNVYYLGPAEMEQFAYDVKLKRDGNKIVLTTDESEVSAFLKIMLYEGARVEVYSAHNYPEAGKGGGEDKPVGT